MNRWLDWKGHSVGALLARLYLGGVFVMACYHKILDPHSFAIDVATYQILPLSFVNFMAIVLPWVELVTGLMLIVGVRVRAAAVLIAAMMLMFTVAVGIALSKGLSMSCGCFASQSVSEDAISFKTILRDLGWFFLAMYIVVVDKSAIGFDTWRDKRRQKQNRQKQSQTLQHHKLGDQR